MRIATASLNQTPLDWNRNSDNIRAAIEWVRSQNTMVLCLPELCISGVGCGLHFKRREIRDKALDLFFELLPEFKGMIGTLGLPLEYEGMLFNTVCLIVDGKPFGFQCKTNYLESDLQELAWFRPWTRHRQSTIELNGETYKFGDMSFEFNLSKSKEEPKTFHVAIEIGEPDWNRIVVPVAEERQKLDLLLHACASPFSFGKGARRLDYARKMTQEFNYIHAFANYVGNESGPKIYDGGSFIAEKGKIVAATPRFSYHDAQVTIATLDSADSTETVSEPSQISKTPQLTNSDSVPKLAQNGVNSSTIDNTSECELAKINWNREEEFSRIVPLGMLDYLRKSEANCFALSLSGGADSTTLATLIHLGVYFALAELGTEGVMQYFAFLNKNGAKIDTQTPTVSALVQKLLVCFYQKTKNSGDVTQNAAQKVASELGAEFHEFDIDKIVCDYMEIVSKGLGERLDWKTHDVAMQNIQARARVPSAWLVANMRGALLLATGNRSESTVGYTTMDGDCAGCLAPIGGIDKAFLRHWLSWMETTGPQVTKTERLKMPFLSAVTKQSPTAELRPATDLQTDETDLMPYSILNRIEQLGIVQGKKSDDIHAILVTEFPQFDASEISHWIHLLFQKWRQNQWKRSRLALSFDLDDETLSGDDWRRFPPL
ncbi:MAG: NAD(+) synthase [Thermoguttaceae bacterium]